MKHSMVMTIALMAAGIAGAVMSGAGAAEPATSWNKPPMVGVPDFF